MIFDEMTVFLRKTQTTGAVEPMHIYVLSTHQTLADCLRASIRQRLPHALDVATELPTDERPRLLLADLTFPVAGLRQAVDDRHDGTDTKILLLGFDPTGDAESAAWLETDIDGVLPVDTGLEEMVDAVERVIRGEKVFPPSVAFLLYERLARRSHQAATQRRFDALTLTRRELEVLRLLGEQRSNDAIAGRLGISIHTVKNHVHNILDKLEVDSRGSAAELARRRGWLADEGQGEASPWALSASC